MGFGQEGRDEISLKQALAAAHRDAAAGFMIEAAVLLHLVEHLVYGHLLSEQIERIGRADVNALAAVRAQIPVDPHLVVRPVA